MSYQRARARHIVDHAEHVLILGLIVGPIEHDLRQLVGERHDELNVGTRRNRFGEGDLHDGAVGSVVIIRVDELDFAGNVAHPGDHDVIHRDRASALGLPVVAGMVAPGFRDPSGLRVESI